MADSSTFPIRFTGIHRAMVLLGITPQWSDVHVEPDRLDVRMSWAFRATIDRSSIRSVEPDDARVFGWGVHGWRGRWLVNASSSGMVRIEIEPDGRARVAGVPVRLSTLRVSLEDPDGFRTAVTG